MEFKERQLTTGNKGHTLHAQQVFSKDDQWIVFDTRNDDASISSTGSIEMVSVESGELRTLYTTENQTEYGPGVGAATFSPARNRLIFIHGIRNADRSRPYGMARRTGVAIDMDRPQEPLFMDARDISPPYTRGALRGGTHAHSWSGDGRWVSFTYNDYVMQELSMTDSSKQDLRMVGVMMPQEVRVGDEESLENNGGLMFSVIVSEVTENPQPMTDEIDRAFDECWMGREGYIMLNGEKQKRAIAFKGNVRGEKGEVITEIFVVDLPDDISRAQENLPLQGTECSRPNVPEGVLQRRITFSENGLDATKHGLRTTPDGSLIAFLAKGSSGIIQVFGVSPNGGIIQQLTLSSSSVQGPFNFSPDGKQIAYPADNSIFVCDLKSKESTRISRRFSDSERPAGAPVWSNRGDKLTYNRYIEGESGRFLQIFLLDKIA